MTVISEYQFKFSFLGELSLYQKEFWTWKAKIFYHIFFNQLHKSQNTRQLCVSFDVTLCVTQCSVPPHVCLPVTVGAYQSLYICKNWQTGFWICDSPVCSLLYGLKLAIHAVWQTKTGWLSSNSLQTDLPASGCRAKTERCRTEIETVVRGIPIFPRSLSFFLSSSSWHFNSPRMTMPPLFLLPRADLPPRGRELIQLHWAASANKESSRLFTKVLYQL